MFAKSGISNISIFKNILFGKSFHTKSLEAIFVSRNEKN
jgi:hypothetical protein